jgi:hypothetical protein
MDDSILKYEEKMWQLTGYQKGSFWALKCDKQSLSLLAG